MSETRSVLGYDAAADAEMGNAGDAFFTQTHHTVCPSTLAPVCIYHSFHAQQWPRGANICHMPGNSSVRR